VILASSLLTIWEPNKPGYVFTENDWNEWAPAQTERLGRDTPGNVTYMAGKVAAERAFWDFQAKMADTSDTRSETAAFSMTAINPALVYGPPVFLPADPAKLSISTKPIWQIYSGGEVPPPTGGSGMSVDVRDVARLFVYAAEHPAETDGQRYLAVGGIAVPQALADILNEAFPERGLKKGTPGAGYDADLMPSAVDIGALKAVKMTGESWIGMRTSVIDTAKALQRYL
jgi:nucleoside-diphosphate-sugar epimerase